MIRIYFGHGTSRLAPTLMQERFQSYGLEAEFIDHEKLRENTAWMKDTRLLVFGGQSVTEFKKALGVRGLQHISAYVENGGEYLGICAGGYFGARLIEFAGAKETKRNDGLKFFNGLAEGSRLEIAPAYTGMTDTAAVVTIRTNDHREFQSLYWGGPSFLPHDAPDAGSHGFAYFTDLAGKRHLMGVQTNVGVNGGRATLLGYHPEISHANICRWIIGNEGTQAQNNRLFNAVRHTDPGSLDRGFDHLLCVLDLKPSSAFKVVPNEPQISLALP